MEGRLFASSAARWSPEGTAALPALAEQHNKGGGPQTVLRAWLQRPIDNFSAHTWNRSPLQDDKGSIIWRLFGSRVAKIDQYSDAGRLHPRNRDDGWKIDAVTCKWFSAEAVFTVSRGVVYGWVFATVYCYSIGPRGFAGFCSDVDVFNRCCMFRRFEIVE